MGHFEILSVFQLSWDYKLGQVWQKVSERASRQVLDTLQTTSRHPSDTLLTPSRHHQDTIKTPSRHYQPLPRRNLSTPQRPSNTFPGNLQTPFRHTSYNHSPDTFKTLYRHPTDTLQTRPYLNLLYSIWLDRAISYNLKVFGKSLNYSPVPSIEGTSPLKTWKLYWYLDNLIHL